MGSADAVILHALRFFYTSGTLLFGSVYHLLFSRIAKFYDSTPYGRVAHNKSQRFYDFVDCKIRLFLKKAVDVLQIRFCQLCFSSSLARP